MSTSIISLSEIAHHMRCDHPFSQRSKTTERTVGLGATGKGESGWTEFEKNVGVGNIGVGRSSLNRVV